MSLMQDIQQGDYNEVSILGGMYKFVADDGLTAFAVVSMILDQLGFDDRMMQCGENPLYEKTGDGKHILAMITLCKPDGQPYSTEEFQRMGKATAAATSDDAGEG